MSRTFRRWNEEGRRELERQLEGWEDAGFSEKDKLDYAIFFFQDGSFSSNKLSRGIKYETKKTVKNEHKFQMHKVLKEASYEEMDYDPSREFARKKEIKGLWRWAFDIYD